MDSLETYLTNNKFSINRNTDGLVGNKTFVHENSVSVVSICGDYANYNFAGRPIFNGTQLEVLTWVSKMQQEGRIY